MRPTEVKSRRYAWLIALGTILVLGTVVGAQAPVPRTGQEVCWDASGIPISCAGTGQDGESRAGVVWPDPRFIDMADGTVVDLLTRLVWLKDANCFAGQTWENALLEIVALNSGSRACVEYSGGAFSDWRLPNVREYASLWSYGEAGPALPDGHPFVDVATTTDYWSSTTSFKFKTRAWTGRGGTGEIYDEDENKTEIRVVWAVRGPFASAPAPVAKTGQQECWNAAGASINCIGTGQDAEFQAGVAWPNPRFSDLGNGTVTDNLTGLIWLQDSECFGWKQWASALSEVDSLNSGARTCAGYAPGTHTDWRLANVREMLSLWDFGRKDPALPEFHPFLNVQTPGTSYWTSTSLDPSAASAWISKTYTGSTFPDTKDINWKLWPVRGGIASTEIFSDGFESGDTSAWSITTP